MPTQTHVCSECFILVYFLYILFPYQKIQATLRLQQPQKQHYPVLQVHAGSFRVSVIHRTMTWTRGYVTCVHNHSYACVRMYTQGLGTPTTSQHNSFDPEKLHIFLVLLTGPGFKPPVFGSRFYPLSHPVTPDCTWTEGLSRLDRTQKGKKKICTLPLSCPT